MLHQDYTGKLLGLEDAIVKDVWKNDDGIHISIEMPRKIHICPRCGASTDKIHDYRRQVVRDAPIQGSNTYLHLNKRRYRCPACGKRFYENVPLVPKYHQVTSRLVAYVIDRFRHMVTIKQIAEECNISWASAARYFDMVSVDNIHLTRCISLDEFRGDSGGQKYQCILTDPKHHRLLDLMPERNTDKLLEYFQGYSDRNNVEYVVMDLSNMFRYVANACFPYAKIVADLFHVVSLAEHAFENTRKQEQNKFSRDYRRYFKRNKSLMRKSFNAMTKDEQDLVSVLFGITDQLAPAYYLREGIRDLAKCSTRAQAARKLSKWMMMAQSMKVPEFERVARTITAWQDEILNAFETDLSNGFTEGCNNKTKVLKRNAYGFRNFKRFRKRRLFLS